MNYTLIHMVASFRGKDKFRFEPHAKPTVYRNDTSHLDYKCQNKICRASFTAGHRHHMGYPNSGAATVSSLSTDCFAKNADWEVAWTTAIKVREASFCASTNCQSEWSWSNYLRGEGTIL